MITEWLESAELDKMALRFGLSRGDRSVLGNGITFRIWPNMDRNDTRTCEYCVELDRLPPWISLSHDTPLLNEAPRMHYVRGDVDFDEVFALSTNRPDEAPAYLTNARRQLLLHCLYDFDEAKIAGRFLQGKFIYSPSGLIQRLEKFLFLHQNIENPPVLPARSRGWVNRSRRQSISAGLMVVALAHEERW